MENKEIWEWRCKQGFIRNRKNAGSWEGGVADTAGASVLCSLGSKA